MSDDSDETVEVALSNETIEMPVACAAWRKVSVPELIQAYVEDWLDVDYPESRGRLTHRGLYRDGPIGLDSHTRETTSRNWG